MVPALKLPEEQPYGGVWHEEVEGGGRTDANPESGAGKGRKRAPARRANPYVALPLVGLLLLGAGLALVHQRVQWMNLTFELEAARQDLTAAAQTHARLRAAVAGAASLERMETTARTRLGMVDPGVHATVVVAPLEAPRMELAEGSGPWTAASRWLQARLMTTAEAGERRPDGAVD